MSDVALPLRRHLPLGSETRGAERLQAADGSPFQASWPLSPTRRSPPQRGVPLRRPELARASFRLTLGGLLPRGYGKKRPA